MKRILFVLLIVLLATTAFAQNKGRIIGTVTTNDGAVITGVNVTISSDSLISSSLTTTTNERGMFRFVLLPVGTFSLKIEKEGYKTIEHTGVEVGFDATVTINKVLTAADFEEVITITGEAPVVDKTSSTVGDKLDLEFLQNQPNIRNVWALPNLSAGFTDDSGMGGVADAGNSFNIDGVNVSDPSTGTVFADVNFEAVEQVDVTLFGANAEYGSFTGASLNVVTKSGGNEFHGEANYFAQRVDWVSDNTGEYDYVSTPTASDIDNYNGALGGPIVQDKVWFFGNLNRQDQVVQRQLIDKNIGVDWQPRRYYAKVSARWDDRNITFGSYTNYERYRSHRLVEGTWTGNYESTLWEQNSDATTYVFQHSFVITESVILEGRYSDFSGGFGLIPREKGVAMYDFSAGQYLPGSKQSYQTEYERGRKNLLLTLNYYNDDLNGSHSFKTGFEYERSKGWRNYEDLNYQYYEDGLPAEWFVVPYFEGGTKIERFAGYAQDSWSVNDKLTINYGFRWDHTGFSADPAENGVFGGDTFAEFDDPAPRIGFAYDLNGDGKTIIRGSVGRYYEGAVNMNFEALTIKEYPAMPYYYGEAYGFPTWTLWATYGGGSDTQFVIHDDFKNQFTEGFMLGVERELMPNVAASASFVYKRDRNPIGSVAFDIAYDTSTIDISGNGYSYSGVYYDNVARDANNYYKNPEKGDPGVLDDLYRTFWAAVFEVNKRFSDNWSMRANYTYSRNEGNIGNDDYGVIQGFDNYSNPALYINNEGRLLLERPHVFKVSGTYVAPFDIYIAPAFSYLQGTPFAVVATPGTETINVKPVDGEDRYDDQVNLDIRINKAITIDSYRLDLIFDVFNVFNDDAVTGFRSRDINSANFMVPNAIVPARFYQVGIRLLF